MDNKVKASLLAGGVLIAMWWFNRSTIAEIVLGDDVDEIDTSMYDQTNPGIYDGGFPGFNSIINIEIDPSAFNTLSEKYIPLFGMIGVVATGSVRAPEITKTRRFKPEGVTGSAGGGGSGATQYVGNSGAPAGALW